MTAPSLTFFSAFSSRSPFPARTLQRWGLALPHRSAWPAPLTAAEADALRSISDEARRRVMRALARDLHLQHHIARFENRHRQMMTVGVCIDADLSGELGTWSGVGPGLARWIRETLLALAREPAAETVASAPQGSEPAGTC